MVGLGNVTLDEVKFAQLPVTEDTATEQREGRRVVKAERCSSGDAYTYTRPKEERKEMSRIGRPPVEPERKFVALSISLEPGQRRKLADVANAQNTTISQIIRQSLEQTLGGG